MKRSLPYAQPPGCYGRAGQRNVRRLPVSKDEVERPAAADVGAGRAQVSEDAGANAARLFQRIGQDGEAEGVEGAVLDAAGGVAPITHLPVFDTALLMADRATHSVAARTAAI